MFQFLLFWGRNYVELVLFLFKCLAELISEAIWAWKFLFKKT